MKQRRRIYYSSEQRNLMWDRWQKGDSMHVIARLFDRGHSSVQRILSEAGEYVNGNEVDQDWRLTCRNGKRYRVVLCQGSRSDRLLGEEVNLNLAYRWFCKLSINDKVPDHSTFSKNRHGRFREAEAFRFVFEQVLRCCMDEGLIGGEGFAVDASVVKADASRQKHHEDDDDDWGGGSRAINEYLDALKGEDPPAVTSAKKVSQTDPRYAGRQPLVDQHITLTRPTTWWTLRPVSSSMLKQRRYFDRRKYKRPRS